jgi:hypothetical protein
MAGTLSSPQAVPSARRRRWLLLASVARVLGVTAAATFLYLTAPLGNDATANVVVRLLLALLALLLVVAWEIRAVIRSPLPGVRGVEAVIVAVPLLLLPFASAYVELSHVNAGAFSEPLHQLDAIYFTVTVFATVGFGDIVARSDPARVMVTVQMIVNLVLIGFVARVLVGVVQERRQELGRTEVRVRARSENSDRSP